MLATAVPSRFPFEPSTMCLLVFAFQQIPDVPVFLAANREESPMRPSIPPSGVREPGGVCWFGGRDGRAGGTWLGVNEAGLTVGITNRSDRPAPPDARSRGLLCRKLLKHVRFGDAVEELQRELREPVYAGFNILLASAEESLVVEHGAGSRRVELAAGLYALTNSGLDVGGDERGKRARREFRAGLNTDAPLSAIVSVAKNVCRSAEQRPQSGRGFWGTVSASVIALPADLAASEFHFAAGPPRETPFESYSEGLRRVLNAETGQ
jgi:uncharacterized protein with NRDE domain